MFEAGFTYILSKSLMNTRTKNRRFPSGDLLFFITEIGSHGLLFVTNQS